MTKAARTHRQQSQPQGVDNSINTAIANIIADKPQFRFARFHARLASDQFGATAIDFALSEFQVSVREAIEKICARFGDDYWLKRDGDGEFAHDFHRALAVDGWLGVCIPERYGESGARHR